MVLGTEYQAAKRKLTAQSEYLFALNTARNKAIAAGLADDVKILIPLIDKACQPMPIEQSLVDEYERAALVRHERTQVPYDQMLFHPDGQVL